MKRFMMVLELKCTNEHHFEGWFANTEAFNRQKESGEIQCPFCEDHQIVRVLSPVAIRRYDRLTSQDEIPNVELEKVKAFYHYIEKNFEEVGSEFTKEALKIHYGAAEKRNIRGTSTTDEEKLLKEEGVEFYKIPLPKGEH
jgi:hypothetical protein